MACKDGVEVVLTDLPQISEINGFKVVGRSTESEKWYLVAKKTGKEIAMEVGFGLWEEILVSFLRITFSPCHAYLDFDEDEFFEDRIQEGANFIISSEW